MGNLPIRVPLTDETAQNTPLKPLLRRIDAFTRKHPEYTIDAPYNTHEGKYWEVRKGGDLTLWDNGHHMMDDLEERCKHTCHRPGFLN